MALHPQNVENPHARPSRTKTEAAIALRIQGEIRVLEKQA